MTVHLRTWCAVALLAATNGVCGTRSHERYAAAVPPVGEARSPREARILEPRAAAVVVDSEDGPVRLRRARALGAALGADYVPLSGGPS